MSSREAVVRALERHGDQIGPVVPADLRTGPVAMLDFSAANQELVGMDLSDTVAFTEYVFGVIRRQGAVAGIGGYGEDRVVYRHSPLFSGESERRSVHLGVDLYLAAGTPVLAPLEGVVHSLADNDRVGDYGPTVILEHRLEDAVFWTLYGHLQRAGLARLNRGQPLARGDRLGRIGDMTENGSWPPHLHLQLITDVGDRRGDFPGVAARSTRREWEERCPDPNLILRIPQL